MGLGGLNLPTQLRRRTQPPLRWAPRCIWRRRCCSGVTGGAQPLTRISAGAGGVACWVFLSALLLSAYLSASNISAAAVAWCGLDTHARISRDQARCMPCQGNGLGRLSGWMLLMILASGRCLRGTLRSLGSLQLADWRGVGFVRILRHWWRVLSASAASGPGRQGGSAGSCATGS